MPELPEVEYAVRRLRRVVRGRTIEQLRAHHPAQRRTITPRVAAKVSGERILDVERRGKHQLLHLASGAVLLVHFRMNGDWSLGKTGTVLPPHARVTLDLSGGRRVVLTDSRALCTVSWHAPGAPPELGLGPEPEDPAVTPALLRERFAKKKGPIKQVLLDQAVLAGIGNIYAGEALWHAKVSPRAVTNALSLSRVKALLAGIRTALADGHINAGRYHEGEREIPFKVYDREGERCRRCKSAIVRITQSGRSTYFCKNCQRA